MKRVNFALKAGVLALVVMLQAGAGWAEDRDIQAQDHDMARVAQLGQSLFDYDRAAWMATDAVLKDYGEAATDFLGGWVVTEWDPNVSRRHPDLRVSFVNKANPPQIIWEARVRKNRVRTSGRLMEPRDLTPEETARRSAVQTAVQHPALEPCPNLLPMNYVVFPVPDDPNGALYTYLMSSTRQPNTAVYGRHFRFKLAADGKTVLDSRGFTNSCLAVPLAPPKGATANAAFTSHILDPVPQETHVFVSLSMGLPVYVSATQTEKIYQVDGTRIKETKIKP